MDPNAPVPRQAKALLAGPEKVKTYEATGGAVTSEFAKNNLTLIPAIPANSIIHDNASGAGTVTRHILAQNPQNVKIHATDIDQAFLDVLSSDAKENGWPVEVSNQRAEKLSFADETFTHSIMNIGIFFTANGGLDAAKEIHRTLKPGGVAIINCWDHITWFFPVKLVHDALRNNAAFPAPVYKWDAESIKKIMIEAGFKEEGLRVEQGEAWAKTRDLRSWAEKSWAFLGGIGGWRESDEGRWEEGVESLMEKLKVANGTEVVDGETRMRASQWVVVGTK